MKDLHDKLVNFLYDTLDWYDLADAFGDEGPFNDSDDNIKYNLKNMSEDELIGALKCELDENEDYYDEYYSAAKKLLGAKLDEKTMYNNVARTCGKGDLHIDTLTDREERDMRKFYKVKNGDISKYTYKDFEGKTLKESIHGNTRQFISNVAEYIEGFFSEGEEKEGWLALEDQLISLKKYARYNSWREAIQQYVEGGSLDCYFEDVRATLNKLYMNSPEEARKWENYPNDKLWDRYINIMCLYIPKAFKLRMGRNLGEKPLKEKNLTRSERYNRDMHAIFDRYNKDIAAKGEFLKTKGFSDEQIEELKKGTGLGTDAIGKAIEDNGWHDEYYNSEGHKRAYESKHKKLTEKNLGSASVLLYFKDKKDRDTAYDKLTIDDFAYKFDDNYNAEFPGAVTKGALDRGIVTYCEINNNLKEDARDYADLLSDKLGIDIVDVEATWAEDLEESKIREAKEKIDHNKSGYYITRPVNKQKGFEDYADWQTEYYAGDKKGWLTDPLYAKYFKSEDKAKEVLNKMKEAIEGWNDPITNYEDCMNDPHTVEKTEVDGLEKWVYDNAIVYVYKGQYLAQQNPWGNIEYYHPLPEDVKKYFKDNGDYLVKNSFLLDLDDFHHDKNFLYLGDNKVGKIWDDSPYSCGIACDPKYKEFEDEIEEYAVRNIFRTPGDDYGPFIEFEDDVLNEERVGSALVNPIGFVIKNTVNNTYYSKDLSEANSLVFKKSFTANEYDAEFFKDFNDAEWELDNITSTGSLTLDDYLMFFDQKEIDDFIEYEKKDWGEEYEVELANSKDKPFIDPWDLIKTIRTKYLDITPLFVDKLTESENEDAESLEGLNIDSEGFCNYKGDYVGYLSKTGIFNYRSDCPQEVLDYFAGRDVILKLHEGLFAKDIPLTESVEKHDFKALSDKKYECIKQPRKWVLRDNEACFKSTIASTLTEAKARDVEIVLEYDSEEDRNTVFEELKAADPGYYTLEKLEDTYYTEDEEDNKKIYILTFSSSYGCDDVLDEIKSITSIPYDNVEIDETGYTYYESSKLPSWKQILKESIYDTWAVVNEKEATILGIYKEEEKAKSKAGSYNAITNSEKFNYQPLSHVQNYRLARELMLKIADKMAEKEEIIKK